MADVEGILALMRHAADRLDAEHGKVTSAFTTARHYADNAKAPVVMANQASYIAAATMASTVLRIVADFMTDTDTADKAESGQP